jgi:hypothetical protein
MDTRGLSLKFYGGKRSKLALDPLLSPPPYIESGSGPCYGYNKISEGMLALLGHQPVKPRYC